MASENWYPQPGSVYAVKGAPSFIWLEVAVNDDCVASVADERPLGGQARGKRTERMHMSTFARLVGKPWGNPNANHTGAPRG